MNSTQNAGSQGSTAAKPGLPRHRAQPARLPQPTADLVNRMLAARCGGAG